jgi:hypothetical protein
MIEVEHQPLVKPANEQENVMQKLVALALFIVTVATVNATPITDKYLALGGPSSFLGAPVIVESTPPDGVGRFRHYKNGSIYWHPQTGAHEVHGLIRQRWEALGWETGYLGYPMTDELDLFDGSGKVTKFQGGELVWRSATNQVSEVKSTDLAVDLPFPVGEPWAIIQANAASDSDSHQGPFAYCWDLILGGQSQSQSNGRTFVAAATAKIVHVKQGYTGSKDANVIIQKLGEGRYASYLHLTKGSYSKMHPSAGITFLPQDLSWEQRPSASTGDALAAIGDTGAAPGAYHLHFCVTTSPDQAAYAPFESVPVAFRNYSVSTDSGQHWTYVPVGVPRNGQWVRREAAQAAIPGTPQVGAVPVISYGTVNGQVALTGDGKPTGAGKIVVRLLSAWGEPLRATNLTVSATAPNGPWKFSFTKVPAYNGSKITVSYVGPWSKPFDFVGGESVPFNLAPNGTATPIATLKMTSIK